MAAPGRVGASLRRHLTSPRARPSSLCSQCLFRRNPLRWQSTAPETPSESSSAPLPPSGFSPSGLPSPPTTTPEPRKRRAPQTHVLHSAMILSRPPLLTRTLTPFEEAFFFYQKRLNDRLSMKFVGNLYYPKKSPSRVDYLLKLEDRDGVIARELGPYRGRGADQWDDEILVGDPLSKSEHIPDVLARDAVPRVSEDAEIIPVEERAPPEMPLPRKTASDEQGDETRLDRELESTLYLLVRRQGVWEFPTVAMKSDEALHEASQRALAQTAGVNMNTWFVGNAPIAHLVQDPIYDSNAVNANGFRTVQQLGQKTFFMKGRIMAGQADLSGNPLGYDGFLWATRDRAKRLLEPELFRAVEHTMPMR